MKTANNTVKNIKSNKNNNKIEDKDRSVHDWYRFILSFPPHLVREYINKFNLSTGNVILDPFCGTGTTLVEAKKQGIESIGVEANPMAYFASRVKVNWNLDTKKLIKHAENIVKNVLLELESLGIEDDVIFGDDALNYKEYLFYEKLKKLPSETEKLILKDSISPIPLHKSLVLLGELKKNKDEKLIDHELLAFAKVLVTSASNLHFGPEVGVRKKKIDALVVSGWLSEITTMSDDLNLVRNNISVNSKVFQADSRKLSKILKPNSIDAVFTSPPYPNEKDYSRTTRLESVLLEFIKNKAELQKMKKELIRSNTRGVYKNDDDDNCVSKHKEIQKIANAIEERRIELGKTSGFERLYAKVTKLYFGGITRHLADLRPILRPGAYLGYVVGDQASYLRILIPTGKLFADIAKSLGYEIISIDLFRTRFASATKEQMKEEVVVLQWPKRNKIFCVDCRS